MNYKQIAKTKFPIGLVVLFIFSFFIVGYTNKQANSNLITESKKEEITYAMPITVAAIPSYVALKKGFWEEEGLHVKAQMFSAGRLALDALLAGSAEVMSVSETPLVHAIIQGNDIYIVATVTEHQETKLIVRRDHGIEQPTDIRGKLVATLPGTNSDYFMYKFLEKHDIGLNEVKITNMPPPDMVTSLVQGNIDAYFAWEPHIYYAKEKLGEKAIVFEPQELYNGRHTIAMNQKFVRENPIVVEKLMRGLLRAENFVKENPEEAMNIVSEVTGMDRSALNTLWKEYRVKVQLDAAFLEILEKEGKWALSLKNLTSQQLPDFRKYIYSEALKRVNPASVELTSE